MLVTIKKTIRFSIRSLSTMSNLDNPIEGFADISVNQGGKSITLHSYKYPSKINEIKAINLLFHGYSEYLKCALRPYATFLAEKGICSIGIDQRGFGSSQGIRGYFESFDHIVSDTIKFLELAKQRDPQLNNKPLLLTGLSMGGASCLHFALKEPNMAKGMIMFSPAVALNKKEVKGTSILSFMAPLLKPFKKLGPMNFPYDLASYNEELLNTLKTDPIIYKGKFPFASILEFLRSEKYLMKNADKLKTPFILFQGEVDRIIDAKAVKELSDKVIGVQNKELVLVPDGDHLLLLDPAKMGKMQEQISSWLSQII